MLSGELVWSGEDRQPTTAERVFGEALVASQPAIELWLHSDPDGMPWLLASYDFVESGAVVGTLRVDFDESNILGGWSPASLNWDSGVRAREASVDVSPPDGLELVVAGRPVAQLAAAVSEWIRLHRPPTAPGRT
jgi:hypothetical protein